MSERERRRFEAAQAIFHEAAELPPAEQSDFVTERCGDDADLREEVESLLAAASEAAGYFDGLVERLGALPGFSAETAEQERSDHSEKTAGPRREAVDPASSSFVSRHKVGVTAAAAVVLMVVVLVITSLRFALVTSRQAREIARERDQAQEVTAFLTELFERPNLTVADGESVTARELLDMGARRIRGGLEADPVTRASLMTILGSIYIDLGLDVDGQALLEESLAIQQEHLTPPHPDLAETLFQLGLALQDRGNPAPSVEALSQALEMRRLMTSAVPRETIAGNRFALARARHQAGDLEAAELEFAAAVEFFRTQELEPDDAYAQALRSWAELLFSAGKLARAETIHTEALEILEGLHGRQDPDVSSVLAGLAAVAMAGGDEEAAEARYREALQIDLGLYGDIDGGNHPGLALSYFNLGRLLESKGDTDEAERLMQQAIRMYRASLRPQPERHATAATFLGSALRGRGRTSEAEALFREAITVVGDAFGPGTLMEADAQVELATLLASQGENGEARRLLESALTSYAPFLAEDHARVLRAREALAGLEG